jgi:hypothetical protein
MNGHLELVYSYPMAGSTSTPISLERDPYQSYGDNIPVTASTALNNTMVSDSTIQQDNRASKPLSNRIWTLYQVFGKAERGGRKGYTMWQSPSHFVRRLYGDLYWLVHYLDPFLLTLTLMNYITRTYSSCSLLRRQTQWNSRHMISYSLSRNKSTLIQIVDWGCPQHHHFVPIFININIDLISRFIFRVSLIVGWIPSI